MAQRHKVKMQISYDGSDFQGFQRQGLETPTIQGELELALSQILDEPISVVGCGRTDAGVHATEYFIHFWTHKNPENYNLVYAINGPLTSPAIAAQNAWIAPDEFHALSSHRKTYKYLIYNASTPSPFKQRYATYDRRPINLKSLNELTQEILGEHDFTSFQTSGTDSKTTFKTFLTPIGPHPRKTIYFTITGDGFLRQMVRNIVGTPIFDRNGHGPGNGSRNPCRQGSAGR
ncbi:MAG: tRNA pseudouridine(38-40) synthase TruA [Bdellovibrionales bacterium]